MDLDGIIWDKPGILEPENIRLEPGNSASLWPVWDGEWKRDPL